MLIYHVALAGDWHAAESVGSYRISTRGRSLEDEGFIHCSYSSQVPGTANTFYGTATEPLVLLAVETALLPAEVVAENAGGGIELFPHVYGPIPVTAVAAVTTLTRDATGRILVPDLPPGDGPLASPRDAPGAAAP